MLIAGSLQTLLLQRQHLIFSLWTRKNFYFHFLPYCLRYRLILLLLLLISIGEYNLDSWRCFMQGKFSKTLFSEVLFVNNARHAKNMQKVTPESNVSTTGLAKYWMNPTNFSGYRSRTRKYILWSNFSAYSTCPTLVFAICISSL